MAGLGAAGRDAPALARSAAFHGRRPEQSARRARCIRMRNADVIDLYDRVKVGTKVVVL
jgi:L,D-transpeptidase catalytic domain